MIVVALLLLSAVVAVVGVSLLGAIARMNTTLAVQSAIQLAYAKHSDIEELQAEAAAIELGLLVSSGLISIPTVPEGEVETQ